MKHKSGIRGSDSEKLIRTINANDIQDFVNDGRIDSIEAWLNHRSLSLDPCNLLLLNRSLQLSDFNKTCPA